MKKLRDNMNCEYVDRNPRNTCPFYHFEKNLFDVDPLNAEYKDKVCHNDGLIEEDYRCPLLDILEAQGFLVEENRIAGGV